MYGIFTYIWVIFGVNVGKYSIHGASGMGIFVMVMASAESMTMTTLLSFFPEGELQIFMVISW